MDSGAIEGTGGHIFEGWADIGDGGSGCIEGWGGGRVIR